MSQEIVIEVKTRKPGRGENRGLRRQREIPAVLYGPKTKNLSLSLQENDAVKYSRREFENMIITFKSDNKDLNGIKVLKKETRVHPVTRKPLHLDFYAPDMTQTVRVQVELKFEGTPKGEKEEGGIFNIVRREIEIECLPADIPESYTVDVSNMAVGDVLHVSDVKIGDMKLMTSEELTICAVAQGKSEEEPAAAAEEAAPAAEGEAAAAAAPAAEEKKD